MEKRKYDRSGPDLHHDRKVENWTANSSLLRSQKFIKSCEGLGIPVTRRQASKFRNRKGLVYNSQLMRRG